MPKKTSSKKKGIAVDFTGVDAGGKAVPDGVYACEVADVTEEEGEKGPYLKWKFRVTDGPAKGGMIYDNTSLTPASLWRLKGLLETLGIEVPDSTMELDLPEYVGMELPITVVNENYQGKDRPKVGAYGGDVGSAGKEPSSGSTSSKTSRSTPDEDSNRLKAGQRVKFTDEGKVWKGKIKSIEDDKATVVTDGDEDEWELELSDLTAI